MGNNGYEQLLSLPTVDSLSADEPKSFKECAMAI